MTGARSSGRSTRGRTLEAGRLPPRHLSGARRAQRPILVVVLARHHTGRSSPVARLALPSALAARWLLHDLRVHPAGFPAPTSSHGCACRRVRSTPSSAADADVDGCPLPPHRRLRLLRRRSVMLVAAVAPALRRRGEEDTMRMIARRFGVGSIVALAVVVATGVALAAPLQLLGPGDPAGPAAGTRPRRCSSSPSSSARRAVPSPMASWLPHCSSSGSVSG